MDNQLIDLIKTHFHDWEDFIGEVYLQLDRVAAAKRRGKDKEAQRGYMLVEIERIRSEAKNEGRTPGLHYRGNMDDLFS